MLTWEDGPYQIILDTLEGVTDGNADLRSPENREAWAARIEEVLGALCWLNRPKDAVHPYERGRPSSGAFAGPLENESMALLRAGASIEEALTSLHARKDLDFTNDVTELALIKDGLVNRARWLDERQKGRMPR